MALSDPVVTTRENIISMVACRETYGHTNQIADHFFWTLLGETLPDDEIAAYAASVAAEDGYDEEDEEEITETLTDWRDKQSRPAQPPA